MTTGSSSRFAPIRRAASLDGSSAPAIGFAASGTDRRLGALVLRDVSSELPGRLTPRSVRAIHRAPMHTTFAAAGLSRPVALVLPLLPHAACPSCDRCSIYRTDRWGEAASKPESCQISL